MTIWNSGEAPLRVNIRIDLYLLCGVFAVEDLGPCGYFLRCRSRMKTPRSHRLCPTLSTWGVRVRHRNFSHPLAQEKDISGLQQIGYRLLAGDSDPLLLGGRVEAYGDPVRA